MAFFGANRTAAMMWNLTAVMGALRLFRQTGAISLEYQSNRPVGRIVDLLRQFDVVGVTERHNDWLNASCAGLGDLALPNCSSPGPHERESVGHPTMADLPPSFVQEVLMSRPGMREEMEIYTEALALADCGPRRRVRIPASARRGSPA